MLTMKPPAPQTSRPASDYERLEYVRCEVCGGPIARGELPPGPYETPLYIQCHNKISRGGREMVCNHRNRFPR
jgi:hypothetical protein